MPTSAWKAAEWAGSGAEQQVVKKVEEEFKRATTHKDDFSFKGLPFDKDGTLANWGHRLNFFSMSISTKAKLNECIDREKQEGQLIALFYFDKLQMNDGEEEWTIQLGDHVTIDEPKIDESGEENPDHYIARVTEIFVTVTGQRKIAVQWLYRMQDTELAEAIRTDKGHKPKRDEEHNHLMVLPVSGDEWPASRLALCGSSEDNTRYRWEFNVAQIVDPVKVYFVPPGISSPEEVKKLHPEFDAAKEYYFNMYTKKDFYTFEDMLYDVTPWSPKYRQVWESKSVKGIEKLRGSLTLSDPDGGFKQLMSHSRGAPELGRELGVDLGHRVSAEDAQRMLRKLELFAGGGGLSFMAQEDDDGGAIVSCWANDFNASACATYACNKPYTFVSCCGLEELLQLLKKWHGAVNKWLGPDWQTLPELQPLLALPPGKRYSRKHMPEGVGCGGGEHPEDALPFIHSAREGQKGREDMQKMLLHFAELPNMQAVKQELSRMQESRDTEPVTADTAAWVYSQAKHAKQQKALHDAKEAALAAPDFEACAAALPEVQLLPDGFDSDSGTIEERAARLLEVVLPRQPSEEHFAAADAQQDAPQQRGKKQPGKQGGAAAAAAGAGGVDYKQAVKDAYEGAWGQQLAALKKNLQRIEDEKLGEVEEVRDVRVRDCAVRVKQGSSARQTQGALTSFECWLEYETKRSGSDEWKWEHEALMQLNGAIPAMQKFMLAMTADKTIPLPRDVDVMTGGPPCQNMSGLNRQARQEDVMNDAKNRLVACYLGTVDHLQPGYLLVEQVTDIYKKEDAKYARFTLMTMLLHGYQGRAGILTAGNYGTPQGRLRAIFWGARAGVERLPPFPAATHQCKAHGINAPKGAEFSIVDALKKGSEVGGVTVPALYPFHVWGDVVGDLPEVDNFAESERQQYKSQPQTYLQQWLRRDPPAHELCLLMRAAHADAAMKMWGPLYDLAEVEQALAGDNPDAILAAGQLAMCQTARWLGNLSKQQARKLAVAHGKEVARAAKAAAAGKGGEDADAPDLVGGLEDEDEEEEEEDDMMDGNEEDAADAAEIKKLMGKEKEFTLNVQLKHLQQSTAGDADAAEELLMMAQCNLHAITQFTGVRSLREMQKAHKSECLLAPLRDQRPHQCNMDDTLRMESLPFGRGVCFRDMDGVVTNPDNTCCAGAWHAAATAADNKAKEVLAKQVVAFNKLPEAERKKLDPMKHVFKGVNMKSGCAGGGNDPKPPKGLLADSNNDKQYRVDNYGTVVKGLQKKDCASATFFLATNGVLCPRWCITYNQGKSIGRNGCFGRIHPDLVQPTVVTRPEPHNLQLVHDKEGRVITVRENARCQAFPDYHVFIGLDAGTKSGSGKGGRVVSERYLQIGNAVAPPMAFALGRCLLLAAAKKAPVTEPVIYSADPEWEAALESGKTAGCVAYAVANNVPREAPDNWERHSAVLQREEKRKGNGKRKAAEEQDAGAAPGADVPAPKRRKSSGSKKSKAAAAAAAAAAGEQDAGAASNEADEPAEPAPKRHKSSKPNAAAAAAAAGSSKPRKKAPNKQQTSAAAAAGGQPAAADEDAPPAAAGGSPEQQQQQQTPKQRRRRQQQASLAAPAAAAAAGADSSEDGAADTAVNDSDQAVHRSPAVAARGAAAGAAAAAEKKRPKRAKAVAAAAAIQDCARQEGAPPF